MGLGRWSKDVVLLFIFYQARLLEKWLISKYSGFFLIFNEITHVFHTKFPPVSSHIFSNKDIFNAANNNLLNSASHSQTHFITFFLFPSLLTQRFLDVHQITLLFLSLS